MEYIICPLCRKIIHRHDSQASTARTSVSSRTNTRQSASLLTEMMKEMERAHREQIQAAENACRAHYRSNHGLRLWLWEHLHWNGIMNKRWVFYGSTSGEPFQYGS
jgi:hypothetical protein